MDPVSTIVVALAGGAAAALKSVAESAVKDAYAGLKRFIIDRYRSVNVELLEADPSSDSRKAVVREDLEKSNAAQDEELLQRAKDLLAALEGMDRAQAYTVGVDLEQIRAARLNVERVLAEGPGAAGVRARDVDLAGDVNIADVTARHAEERPPKA